MPEIKVNDIKLYYEVKGEGRPLLLIAGLMSDSQSWMPVSDMLAEKFMVITPDNRGAGRTAPQEEECSIEGIADDIIALLDYLKLDRVDILGHSMGGFVAQVIAAGRPERVRYLILEATSTRNSASKNKLFSFWGQELEDGVDRYKWFTEVFNHIFSTQVTENSEMMRTMLEYSVNYPYPQSVEAYKNQIKAISEFDGEDLVEKIRAGTLIICGEDDRMFSIYEIVSAFSELAFKQISVVEGAGHALHVEKPDEFVELVSRFIE